jgi:hypothetical protein
MTVGEIRDEVVKMLGNSLAQSGHPFISPTNLVYLWITRACNKVPRLVTAGGADILITFPELFARWKAQTAEGIGYLDRPAEALVIREVRSFDKTGATADYDPERLVYQERDIGVFNTSGRNSATSPGFPSAWSMQGNRLHFKPLPRAPYLTDVHEYGIKKEATTFNSDAQTPKISADWHEAVTIATAAIGARDLGYFERAKVYDSELAVLVRTGVDVAAQEDLYDDPTFDLAGLPTQEEIYG